MLKAVSLSNCQVSTSISECGRWRTWKLPHRSKCHMKCFTWVCHKMARFWELVIMMEPSPPGCWMSLTPDRTSCSSTMDTQTM